MKKNNYPPIKLDDQMKFGKYKSSSKDLEWIIKNDFQYIRYLVEELDVELDDEAFHKYSCAEQDYIHNENIKR